MNWKETINETPELKVTKEGGLILQEASVECLVYDGETVFVDHYDEDEGFHSSITHWIRLEDVPAPKSMEEYNA